MLGHRKDEAKKAFSGAEQRARHRFVGQEAGSGRFKGRSVVEVEANDGTLRKRSDFGGVSKACVYHKVQILPSHGCSGTFVAHIPGDFLFVAQQEYRRRIVV